MNNLSWLVYALLGAAFAGIVNVLCKKALNSMDFLLALTIQGFLILLTLATMTTAKRRWSAWHEAPRRAMMLMALAGIAAGLAWFFGYRALQLSDVHHTSPIDKLSMPIAVVLALIFLGERPTAINWFGIVLMLAGAFCVANSSGSKG